MKTDYLTSPSLATYAALHSTPPSKCYRALQAETRRRCGKDAEMLSGPEVAWLLRSIILGFKQGSRPIRILEIGRFTGGTALAMAELLNPDRGDLLITIDTDDGVTNRIALKYWKRAEVDTCILSFLGDARRVIRTDVAGEFDLVFIDGLKTQYCEYWKLVVPLMSERGIIVADDTLWGGNINDPASPQGKALKKFNQMVLGDNRVRIVQMLTIGDGVTVAHMSV